MPKQETVISLDSISQARRREKGLIGRLLVTRWSGGKRAGKDEPFGHYLFCGPQGAGKTASALWYAEKLAKKYQKKGKKVVFFSNIGIGEPINDKTLADKISALEPSSNEVRIVLVDEIQAYFPRDGQSSAVREQSQQLIALFSQLRKRSCFILSTAQIYGRLDKSLREQCLYAIFCKRKASGKLRCEFVKGDDILCDELGRWSGDPAKIWVHGLSKLKFDSYKIIKPSL